MVKWLLFSIALGFGFFLKAQNNTLFMASFYKDHLNQPSYLLEYQPSNFLPITENELPLTKKIADSSIQYYDFTETLFKKHLIEVRHKDYNLNISPIFNFAMGKEFNDTVKRRLFQNTRGAYIDGTIGKQFSFFTYFVENQARFATYQREFYLSNGEFYPQNSDSSYQRQNAVILGGGRTKPFKIDAFDYAYAVGNFVYTPFRFLKMMAGNNPRFVGNGYRSMLLADNSHVAPYFRIDWKINSKWSYTYDRARLLNLMRRPYHSTPEAMYETKLMGTYYLSYQASQRFKISLFEGAIWSKGDSISQIKTNPLFFNPVPIINHFLVKQHKYYAVTGIDLSMIIGKQCLTYAQFASGNFEENQFAWQLGTRWYPSQRQKNMMLQLEYNGSTENMYQSENARINYSHSNLAMAHPKGNGFQELLLRANYEWKRCYINLQFNQYFSNHFKQNALSPVQEISLKKKLTVFYQQTEIGYRFNRKMNFSVFVQSVYRNGNDLGYPTTFTLSGGIKTAIFNTYQDF